LTGQDVRFFDIMRDGKYLDETEQSLLACRWRLPWVPVLYSGKFNLETIKKLAIGKSEVPGADCIREGIVIRPMSERIDEKLGRVIGKIVSPQYLEECR